MNHCPQKVGIDVNFFYDLRFDNLVIFYVVGSKNKYSAIKASPQNLSENLLYVLLMEFRVPNCENVTEGLRRIEFVKNTYI